MDDENKQGVNPEENEAEMVADQNKEADTDEATDEDEESSEGEGSDSESAE